MFIPKDKIEWKKVKYLKIPWQATDDEAEWLYELWLNEPLASWDVFSIWEIERVLSMRKHLKKGNILFDIGTEQGWCDLVYAQIVGPENMVLVEPTPEFWPNIKALWGKNFNMSPRACYPGFFSDKTSEKAVSRISATSFPHPESDGDLIDRNSYKNLFDESHLAVVEQIKLDDFVKITGVVPDALTIDVEAAELFVLKGAKKTLKENNLQIFVSEHPDMALRDYEIKPGEVTTFMKSLGYERELLAVDHETHVRYFKP